MSLEFYNEDPGAVFFGNFINYYQFNTPEQRISLFPEHLWTNWQSSDGKLIVLDIGCNAGNLTEVIYKFLVDHTKRDVQILGVDIDPTLVERALEKNTFPDSVNYQCLDFMEDSSVNEIRTFLTGHNRKEFDVIMCLSITMWIHLNHGDDGLKDFLKRVSNSHLLILEPQPWKCYRTAVKRMKKAKKDFPRYSSLKIQTRVNEFISDYVEKECGMERIYESGETKWGRKLCFFRQKR
ncbi:RNA methyltransferase [Sergentomyia squamirostris]